MHAKYAEKARSLGPPTHLGRDKTEPFQIRLGCYDMVEKLKPWEFTSYNNFFREKVTY